MNYKHKVGNIYKTNCGVDAQIIATQGFGRQRVLIKWLDEFGHECVVKSSHLCEGKVLNPFAKLNYGVGYLGVGDYKPSTHKKHYSLWASVMTRCFSESYKIKKPTYEDCTLSEKWHCFQDFAAWCDLQTGFGLKDYEIDKDLLLKGNKEYDPEYCRIVPNYVNSVLSASGAIRGQWPLGVYYQKGGAHKNKPFSAQIKTCNGGKATHLGVYNEAKDAHKAWQLAKVEQIFQRVNKYSFEKAFDTEVADALLSRAWELKNNAEFSVETKLL